MSMERIEDPPKHVKGIGVVPDDACPTKSRKLTLECFPTFSGTGPIKRFLEHVKGFSDPPPREEMTSIYRPGLQDFDGYRDGGWRLGATRPARSLESVALEQSKKEALISDVAYYLTDECRRFYANRGYPYRRGFLLYGPPGTGKTSFCVAMAGHFQLDVYILSLSDRAMTDQRLEDLFQNLPDRCILLLEDIDSAGLERELGEAELKRLWVENPGRHSTYQKFAAANKTGLTLSGMLNCLDGPVSKDGRIVCMTTNAPDNLDPALIRPGRCDHKVLFGYASEEICTQLFGHLYTKREDELVEGEASFSENYDIPALAQDFAHAIPQDSKISPAEVQGYLMIHRQDPRAAVQGAADFAAEIIETKERGANVAEHANEVDRTGRKTYDIEALAVARQDYDDSDDDQSGHEKFCDWCGWDACSCATTHLKIDENEETDGVGPIEKHSCSPTQKLSGKIVRQTLSLLRLVS